MPSPSSRDVLCYTSKTSLVYHVVLAASFKAMKKTDALPVVCGELTPQQIANLAPATSHQVTSRRMCRWCDLALRRLDRAAARASSTSTTASSTTASTPARR